MRVLISVLGKLYEKYKEVDWYRAGQSTEPFRTRMPAQALARAFQVDHTLILIPDSLNTASTYLELQKQSEKLLPDAAWKDLSGELHRFVLPSRYSGKVLGDIRDFYQASIFFLAKWFAEHLSNPDIPLELYLETSTGLNILQLMTYRAVREIAGALAFFRQVSLEVYNADPVGQSTTQGEIFPTEIYRPLRAALNRFAIHTTPRLFESYNRHPHPGQDRRYRDLRDRIAHLWPSGEIVSFLNSVYYGIPLGIIRWFCSTPSQIFEDLKQLYNFFLEQAHPLEEPVLRFLRPVRLGVDFAPYALGALLSHQLQSRWNFFSANLKSEGITYQQMKDMMSHMYRDHPVIRNRFEAERTIQPNALNCITFPALLNQCLGSSEVSCESVDKRNFFAHAGFERCAVKVDRKNGEIYFRFAEEKEDIIQNFLRGA